jgi:hypothetical protein
LILVDTSVWINHFRSPNNLLCELLEQEEVLLHPFVLGEIACGNFKRRKEILALMQALPTATKADEQEILLFIEKRSLMGRGIGPIDVHLLAACLIEPCSLWTFDKRLRTVADELETAFVRPR